MTRLQRLLSAAAALIIGGATVTVAMYQAAQDEGYTRKMWSVDTAPFRDRQKWDTFYIAVPTGTEIPKAFEHEWSPEELAEDPAVESWPAARYVLGDCSGGQCCLDDYCYDYSGSPLVNGYRLFEVYAHRYFAKGWKAWADDTAGVHWWWSFGQVVDACRANFTDVQCLQLLEGDKRCWKTPTGCCRFGLRGCEPTVSGLNGTPCPYATVTGPMPCVTNRGAGSAMRDAVRPWEDLE